MATGVICGGCGRRELQDHEMAWPNFGYCDQCVDEAEERREERLQYNPYSDRWFDPEDPADDEV